MSGQNNNGSVSVVFLNNQGDGPCRAELLKVRKDGRYKLRLETGFVIKGAPAMLTILPEDDAYGLFDWVS